MGWVGGWGMAILVRSLVAVCCAVACVVATALSWAVPRAIILSANTTALIMGGSFHPLIGPKDPPDFVKDYLDNAVTGLLDPAFGGSGPVTNAVAVYTPEDFFPLGRLTFEKSLAEGLANLRLCVAAASDCVFNQDPMVGSVAPEVDDAKVVFGYSQSAVIASLLKRELIEKYGPDAPPVSFLLDANSMRPNGGILMRFDDWPTIPILGIPFPGASPTDSVDDVYRTIDIARQYDGLGGDFPVRPLNLIATLNALLGYGMLHGETVNVPLSEAQYQGREGDTRYYLIETDIVPLLQPFQLFVPKPILKALDAPLRVIIEDAYDRDIGPGVPTPASWRPFRDFVGMVVRLVASIPVAVDNLTEGFGLGRVLGTTDPGPFGVGGPELLSEPEEAEDAEPVASESDSASPDPERAEVATVVADEAEGAARREDTDDEIAPADDEPPAADDEPPAADDEPPAADDELPAEPESNADVEEEKAPPVEDPAADDESEPESDAAEAA